MALQSIQYERLFNAISASNTHASSAILQNIHSGPKYRAQKLSSLFYVCIYCVCVHTTTSTAQRKCVRVENEALSAVERTARNNVAGS